MGADGAPVSARTQEGDLTELRSADLSGTVLVTASAVLDLLTAEEVARARRRVHRGRSPRRC